MDNERKCHYCKRKENETILYKFFYKNIEGYICPKCLEKIIKE